MRLILGLDRPTAGTVTVNGRAYVELAAPLREVGALLEARAVHTSRSAYNHLRALAASHGIPRSRVDQVIDLVGLHDVARQRAGQFSLGMGQRLGIASALLGDPATVVLDEPVNGLDPEGIRWVRELLKQLAGDGRTVFVSSHLLAEIAQTADRVIVIGRGRLIADTTVEQLIRRSSARSVRVRTPDGARLADILTQPGVTVEVIEPELLTVTGMAAAAIGDVARDHRVALHELTPEQGSLEEAFMEMTTASVEFHASTTPSAA